MVAALPMYFPPDGAVEAFWQTLANTLREIAPQLSVPAHLIWPADYHAHWLNDDVLISQTCGYPLTTELFEKVQVLGAFAYDAPGASGVQCTSQLICRSADARNTLADFQGSTLAFNAADSQSGYNALRAMVATQTDARPFFGKAFAVGSHVKAIESVRAGTADMAAVDCVTLALWQRSNPALAAQIRVFGRTPSYPGLPLVTSSTTTASTIAVLRSALAVVATESRFAPVRAPLLICGFAPLHLADYFPCLEMRAQAITGGTEAL
jgi:ABC-type phosphate/phosphonate transport system substrate-binding protein